MKLSWASSCTRKVNKLLQTPSLSLSSSQMMKTEMVLKTLVYPPFYHLMSLLAHESFTELMKDTKACHKTQPAGQQLNSEPSK
jgi:hypothetical protein